METFSNRAGVTDPIIIQCLEQLPDTVAPSPFDLSGVTVAECHVQPQGGGAVTVFTLATGLSIADAALGEFALATDTLDPDTYIAWLKVTKGGKSIPFPRDEEFLLKIRAAI